VQPCRRNPASQELGDCVAEIVLFRTLRVEIFFQELRMLKKAAALFLVGASLATWLGCTTNSSAYLYAAIPASSKIVVYREDPNSGILTVLVGSPITAGRGVHSIAIHPSKKFLYAANNDENDVSLFTISTGGSLTEVTPRTIAGTAPNLLAMDPAGAFLYVSNSGSNTISVFSLDATSGALAQVGAPFPIGGTALNMKLSPSGDVLFVTVAGNPDGFVESFSNPSSGTPLSASIQTGINPDGLAIDPSGTHLYTANSGENSISAFTIGANGILTPISGFPLGESYAAPIALFIDNSGKYLYVANEGSNNLAAYGIGSDGGLTLLSNSPFSTDSQPSFITSDASGKYLFVGNQVASGASIHSFSLDGSTGTLTSVRSFGVGSSPSSIALTP
jgi:6-phosphogluconolactonase (cycloisomerase 2 family)